MAKQEIEIKLPLLNARAVTKYLDEHAKFAYENHQIDTYYDSKQTGWTKHLDGQRPIDFWLRVREENDRASLNFKDYSGNRRHDVSSCAEFESIVAAPADVKNILERAGFFVAAIVDKTRRAYRYRDYEIAIDKVKNLGDYIEIEYYGSADDVEKIKDGLNLALAEIGAKTGAQDLFGYPYLLMMKTRHLTRGSDQARQTFH
jgi:adenylate cyclase class 2